MTVTEERVIEATTDPVSVTAGRIDRARELVRALAVSANNAALYPSSHPLMGEATDALVSAVDRAIEADADEVRVNIFKSTLFVDDHVLPDESLTFSRLIEDLLARGVSALRFSRGFDDKDAVAITGLIGTAEVTDIDSAWEYLGRLSVQHAWVSETAEMNEQSAEERQEFKDAARSDYDRGAKAMRDVETRAKLGRAFDVAQLQELVSSLLDKLFRDPAAILGLAAIKSHDEYSLGHSINVCILALSLGASVELPADQLESLGLSALLYDIGKVRIPEEILGKRGPLTAEEWEIVKGHAVAGADLLERIQLTDRMPMVVAYEHHMRYDQRGYPTGPGAGEQHVFSRIVAICDAYDAMTTRRPFRREIRPDKAIAVVMQGRGKAYDPQLTKAFVGLLGIYPIGAVVKLDDSSTAVVFRVNGDDLLRPKVKVVLDRDGRFADSPEVTDMRVMDPKSGTYRRTIVECTPALEAGIDDVWVYL